MNFLKLANDIKEDLIKWRRDFHMNPELGFEEYVTSFKIKEFLKGEGISYYETAQTGICAYIKGNGEKTVAIRADMDALPINEAGNKEYKSKFDGKMHACGHDAHIAMAMGAAKILNSIKESLNGNVKIFFEPAEETDGGAPIMIEEGVLKAPKVDAVIGLHVNEYIESGNIAIKKGVVNAASNPFKIIIKGKGTHGAYPHNGVDPIVIGCTIVNTLQTIVSREIAPQNPAVLTIGYFNGGTAVNIVPGEVQIGGILRTLTKEDREFAINRLKEICEGVASSMRGEVQIEVTDGYPCLYNNDEILSKVILGAEKIIGKEKIKYLNAPSMGVESFAYFSNEVPSAFYYLGTGNATKGTSIPAHNCRFDIDEEALPIGTAIHCSAVWELLADNSKLS